MARQLLRYLVSTCVCSGLRKTWKYCECIHGKGFQPQACFFGQVRLFLKNRLFMEEPLTTWTLKERHIRNSGAARKQDDKDVTETTPFLLTGNHPANAIAQHFL